jgi:hypothetical protein
LDGHLSFLDNPLRISWQRSVAGHLSDHTYGGGHRTVCLDALWPGRLILDVVHDDIAYVEVLYRSRLC